MIRVEEGQTLLSALRDHGFRIPTLCHMNRFSPTGACRLCVVEVDGRRDLVTSCSCPAENGMKVRTNSQRVIRARKSLVELLLSNHPDDCLYCQRNGHCELQLLAEEMNIKERKYFGQKNRQFPDYSSTSVARDPAKCILCSRCVRMCEEVQLVTAIDFISRGNRTSVNSAFSKGLNMSTCIHCGQCIQVCPTAALFDISHVEKVQGAIERKDRQVLFFISPAAISSVTEQLKLKSKHQTMPRIVAALKRIGAAKVFDLGPAIDANIIEEAKQLADRLQNNDSASMPMLSSCCPSWVKYIETFRPESLPALAQNPSPQHTFGRSLKSNHAGLVGTDREKIYSVAVMPCVANKYEASLEKNTRKGISDVDAVLTVRELFQLLKAYGLDIPQMEDEKPDEPFNNASSAAWKYSYSGGKAEAMAYEVYRLLNNGKTDNFRFIVPKNTAGKRETRVTVGKHQLGFAWVSGIAEAEAYLHQLEEEKRNDIHYIEVMACSGGCVGGGGQPISRGFENARQRKKISIDMEKSCRYKYPSDHKASEK